jgi:hypothetical protein
MLKLRKIWFNMRVLSAKERGCSQACTFARCAHFAILDAECRREQQAQPR